MRNLLETPAARLQELTFVLWSAIIGLEEGNSSLQVDLPGTS